MRRAIPTITRSDAAACGTDIPQNLSSSQPAAGSLMLILLPNRVIDSSSYELKSQVYGTGFQWELSGLSRSNGDDDEAAAAAVEF